MKKLLFALAAALLLIFSACRNDDDSPSNPPLSPLVGTWKLTKAVAFSGTGNTVLQEIPTPACEGQSTFQFRQDNKFTFKTYSSATGTCTLDSTDDGTYAYNTNTKIMTFNYNDGTSETTQVKSLSNTEMQILIDTEDVNDDGTLDQIVAIMNKQ